MSRYSAHPAKKLLKYLKIFQKPIDKYFSLWYNPIVVEPQTAGYSKSLGFPAEEKRDIYYDFTLSFSAFSTKKTFLFSLSE